MADDPDLDERACSHGLTRRALLRGVTVIGGVTAGLRAAPVARASPAPSRADRWSEFRALFELDPARIHLAGMLLASHPRPVGEAIERHRAAFEDDPATYVQHHRRQDARVRAAAARYLGAKPHEVALTFNTTTGLGLVYGGVAIRGDQRFLTTEHDYSATHSAIRYRAARVGAEIDVIRLYDRAQDADADQIVERVLAAVQPGTRVVALTWVHSSTGVKLPVRQIADGLAELNRDRDERDRALLCVDGVHGLGVEDVDVAELGCDVLIAGTHKWLFGPRGTGLVWAREAVHDELSPVIHTFTGHAGWGGEMTPGGYHAFDHRWALPEAFELHARLGKPAIAERIHELNRRFKEELAGLRHVTVLTPLDDERSAGIICFQVRGRSPAEVVGALRARDIIASTTPYRPSYARLAPGLLNNLDEITPVVSAIRALR